MSNLPKQHQTEVHKHRLLGLRDTPKFWMLRYNHPSLNNPYKLACLHDMS